MIYTIYSSASKPVISFFSIAKVRMYVEANPGKYTICDGHSRPKALSLEDLKWKETIELEKKLQKRWK
jgi:hypothetical protein